MNDPKIYEKIRNSPNVIAKIMGEFLNEDDFEYEIKTHRCGGNTISFRRRKHEPFIRVIHYDDIRDEDCCIAMSLSRFDFIFKHSQHELDLNIFPDVTDEDRLDLYMDKICFKLKKELYDYICNNCFTFVRFLNGDYLFYGNDLENDLVLINDYIHEH